VIEWRRHCIKKRREGCFHFQSGSKVAHLCHFYLPTSRYFKNP
jgi:hypothetical protein